MKNGEGKYLFLWGRRKKGEGKGGNYLDKEINGDTDRPTNQPGEYSARVRKRENILNSKIFVAKTLRIKRINCVNFQILQIEIIWTLFRLSGYHPDQEWTGKLFFSRGGAGQGQKSMGQGKKPPLLTVRVKSVFASISMVKIRDARGSLFLLRGRAEEKNFGLGQAVKSSERGRVTVKLEAFSGWGGAGRGSLEKFQDRAGPGQPFSLGPGWGVHPWSIYAP